MRSVKILDCTLRDGGYVNNWNFGNSNINNIIDYLNKSNIDIIECGFLSNVQYNNNITLFNDLKHIEKFISHNMFVVAMIAIGENNFHYDNIPAYDGKSISGIRLTFHKNEIDIAIEYAKNLISKNYKLFMQPVGTMAYTKNELSELLNKINSLNPFAFYIVDTLGEMDKNSLIELSCFIDKSLNDNIELGIHLHNNLQLAFSNSKEFLSFHTKRNIIIDSSVFGIGRGAGNLCTELVTGYLNDIGLKKYDLNYIFDIIDNQILKIKNEFNWGYSAHYYLAAKNRCHPNYAKFLIDKQKFTSVNINNILSNIDIDKQYIYDEEYINNIYFNYNNYFIDDSKDVKTLQSHINNKNIVVLGAGKTLKTHFDTINKLITNKNTLVISLNRSFDKYNQDYIFMSNFKRYKQYYDINNRTNDNIILTSNLDIDKSDNMYILNYNDYIYSKGNKIDNVGLLLLNFLSNCNVKKIYLAGFDGIKFKIHDNESNNYYESDDYMLCKEDIDVRNKFMKEEIQNILTYVSYEFITPSLYE